MEVDFTTANKETEYFKVQQYQRLIFLAASPLKMKPCSILCGMGKSRIMAEYINLKNVNKIVVITNALLINQLYSTLKSSTQIPIICVCSKGYIDSVTLKQDSGLAEVPSELRVTDNITCTKNPDIIKNELTKDKLIVLCTYKRSKLLNGCKFDLGLYDEAHNIVIINNLGITFKVNSNNLGITLKDEFCSIDERVFFTATPNYY